MGDLAIRVEHLSKQYRIGKKASYMTFSEAITDASALPFKRIMGEPGPGEERGMFWALKDLSFDIKQGEVIGIIGRNGAGKSTLLKILSRITEPTEGSATVYGRVGSLLEVGTGFHPELTGRENVYLSGTILGMKKSEINAKFDEIVKFAEVEKFLDTPMKHYSTGMQVRLGFAVAAHLEPEILIIDEVLAVGDAAFQKKCLGKMGDISKDGRTVLFVSHNMQAVQTLCDRAILLGNASIQADGSTSEVISAYLGKENIAERVWDSPYRSPGNESVRLHSVRVLNFLNVNSARINTADNFSIEIIYDILLSGKKMGVTAIVYNSEGICVFSSINNRESRWYGKPRPAGRYRSMCEVPRALLSDGQYTVTIYVWEESYRVVCREDNAVSFEITDTYEARGDYMGVWSGVVRPLLEWHTEQLEG